MYLGSKPVLKGNHALERQPLTKHPMYVCVQLVRSYISIMVSLHADRSHSRLISLKSTVKDLVRSYRLW